MNEDVITKLFSQFQQKGFLTSDEIFTELVSSNVSIVQTERICSNLLSKGVLISDSNPQNASADEKTNFDYDKAHINYDELFDQIIKKEPNLKFLVDYIRKIQPPQLHEVENLYPQIQSGNKFARNRLFEMNMRMALKLAYQKAREFHLSLEDTVQNAMAGLWFSIEKYDISRHGKFQGYSIFWILNYINRNKSIEEISLSFPAHLQEKLDKIYKYVRNEKKETSDECFNTTDFVKDIEKYFMIDESKAILYLNYVCPMLEYSDLTDYQDLDTSDDGKNDPFNLVARHMLQEQVQSVLNTIPLREQEVLKWRFGFYDNQCLTLEEIGESFHLSRERIRQIENKALRRLRHPSRACGLRDYL